MVIRCAGGKRGLCSSDFEHAETVVTAGPKLFISLIDEYAEFSTSDKKRRPQDFIALLIHKQTICNCAKAVCKRLQR